MSSGAGAMRGTIDAARARAASACSHCGLPVPAGLVESGAEHQFCCHGCRTVFGLLHEKGLDRYYALRGAGSDEARPAKVTDRTYAEFDDPSFETLYCRDLPAGGRTAELYLEGVHCAACVWLVERVPRLVPGAVEVRLDIGRSRASVVWDPARTPLSAIARTLDSLGYPAHPFRGAAAHELQKKQDRAMMIRLGITGAAAGNTMAIAFAIFGGILNGMEPEFASFFRWTGLLVTIPALIWGGGVFFRGALSALRTRALHMDVPISLGIAIAFGSGAYNTVRGAGPVYFDSVCALIFLLLSGRFVQGRQQRAAADSAELLHALAPSVAHLVEDGTVREVPIEALVPGARVEVRAGDTIPADGVVFEGTSSLDTSLLTGESLPALTRPGQRVHAGTVNLSAPLRVDVDAAGEGTRVGRLMRLVEEHARRRAPIVQLADRISGWFVLVVLFCALATGLLWWRLDPTQIVDNVVALLIVTCPCALGLATPLAVSAAIGQAARAGLLIKGADVVERLVRPGRLWLDKTGTLTEGRVALAGWWGDESVKPAVAALEAASAHPVARAFVAALGPAPAVVTDVHETLGGGLTARWGGTTLAVGSPAFVASTGAVFDEGAARAIDERLALGETAVAVAAGGSVVAVAGFGDPVRADARVTIEAFRRAGWHVGILSGDDPRVVAAVGRTLGLEPADCRGAVLPEQKLAVVAADVAAGRPVVMAGDGVNDAAALSAATVGIGVHGGAEASLAAADVYSTKPGLAPLALLLGGARRAMHVIRRNLVISLCYNVVGVALAAAGYINPLTASILMPLSSITVIFISFRARTFRGAA